MKSAALLLLLATACGDARIVLPRIDPVSGSRLKLEKFLYEDGTRQVDSSAFYDTRLHALCTPRVWADGVLRCVPVAADALFIDNTCTAALGVSAALHGSAVDLEFVTHFIGYDWVNGEPVPSRLYSAGDPTTAVDSYYELRDGVCTGPLFAPFEVPFYKLLDELSGLRMPQLEQVEVGTGRLALQLLTTTDGLRVPVGLRDRDLDAPCVAGTRPDGDVCEPTNAVNATWYADLDCTVPAVVVDADSPAPAVARREDPDGCPSYAPVAGEVTGPVFRRDGAACVQTTIDTSQRVLALGESLELPRLDRTLDGATSRRLAGVILHDEADPALRFSSDGLVDRAIRDDCRRELVGDTYRCMPARTRPGFTLSTDNCTIPVPVVALPARTCGTVAFATLPGLDGAPAIHAIGDRVTVPLSILRGDTCVPYEVPPDVTLHGLGPALPPETFASALSYGER